MKTIIPIYELEEDYKTYLDLLTSEDDDRSPEEIEQLRDHLATRGQYAVKNYQSMRDTFEDYITVLKSKVSDLQARIKYLQLLDEVIKDDLTTAMRILDTKTVHLPEYTISLQEGRESIEVYDIDKVPAKYRRATIKLSGELAEKILATFKGENIKVVFEADKVALKELNKQGLGTVGAEIVKGKPIISVRRK